MGGGREEGSDAQRGRMSETKRRMRTRRGKKKRTKRRRRMGGGEM